MTSLQNLPLDILLDIAAIHPWVACELSKTVREVGLYSLQNDMKSWFKMKEGKENTFILVKNTKEPYFKVLYHSWNDKPANISHDIQTWFKRGAIHRGKDLPAVIYLQGRKEWYKEDKLHRDNDLPAIIRCDGGREWYKEGRYIKSEDPTILDLIRWNFNFEQYL